MSLSQSQAIAGWKEDTTVEEQRKRSNRAVYQRPRSSAPRDLSAQSKVSKSKAVPLGMPVGTLGGAAAPGPPHPAAGDHGSKTATARPAWGLSPKPGWKPCGEHRAGELAEMITLISAGIKAPGREKYLTWQGSILQRSVYVPVLFPANFCFVKATGKYFLGLTKQWNL